MHLIRISSCKESWTIHDRSWSMTPTQHPHHPCLHVRMYAPLHTDMLDADAIRPIDMEKEAYFCGKRGLFNAFHHLDGNTCGHARALNDNNTFYSKRTHSIVREHIL